MSIVICVIDKNDKLYLASDKRAVRNGVVDDDYKKIYKIKNNVYFGMTGIAEEGLKVLSNIEKFKYKSVYEIIENVSSIIDISDINLTVMISGKDESGDLFCWQKNNSGETSLIKGNSEEIKFAISSNDDISIFSEKLQMEIIDSGINQGIINTIEYASSINSYISRNYDLIHL
ncbi:hypothetical protein [Paraclostridium bifermentans]|uniref:hypothetical protein n=1 Tax=Paraclostridium bifermentans TaxID=1490 RepID=UPI0003F78235|nr:hypothetical protein [Paraclostridium bifermentans]